MRTVLKNLKMIIFYLCFGFIGLFLGLNESGLQDIHVNAGSYIYYGLYFSGCIVYAFTLNYLERNKLRVDIKKLKQFYYSSVLAFPLYLMFLHVVISLSTNYGRWYGYIDPIDRSIKNLDCKKLNDIVSSSQPDLSSKYLSERRQLLNKKIIKLCR